MSISTKKIRAVLRYLVANQKLTISVLSLIAQMYLMHLAPQLMNEPGGPIVMISTWVTVLIFNSWLIDQFDNVRPT